MSPQPSQHCERPLRGALAAAAFCLPVLLLAMPARAQWAAGGVPISVGPVTRSYASIISDGAGGAIVMWLEHRAAGPTAAQRINQDGVTLWTTNGVTVPGSPGGTPAMASDLSGGALVFWQGIATPYNEILGQRINGDGVAQWNATTGVIVRTLADGTKGDVQVLTIGGVVVTDPAGAVVVWEQNISTTSTSDMNIYAQRVDNAGSLLWSTSSTAVGVCTVLGDQSQPQMVTDGTSGIQGIHGAYVAWNDARAVGPGIYVNRINNSGTPLWPGGVQVFTVPGFTSTWFDLAYVGSHNTIVTWTSGSPGAYDIYAQEVLANGTLGWASPAAICTEARSQYESCIVSSSGGGAIIAWYDERDDPSGLINGDIYAQAIDASGNPLWGAGGVPVCSVPGRQYHPQVVSDGAGGAIVVWEDYRVPSQVQLYLQRLDPTGHPMWTPDGVPLVTGSIPNSFAALLPDFAGGLTAAWENSQPGESDVYASRALAADLASAGAPPAGGLRLAFASANPSHGAMKFTLELREAADVTAEVLDLQGRVVKLITPSEDLGAGSHVLAWDGTDQKGDAAAAGLYFARVRVGREFRSLKLVELR